MHEREAEAQLEGFGLVAHRSLQHVVRIQQVVQQLLLVETATYQPCAQSQSAVSEKLRVISCDDHPRPPRRHRIASLREIYKKWEQDNAGMTTSLSLSLSLSLFLSPSFCRCPSNVYLLKAARAQDLPHLPTYPIASVATPIRSSQLLFANTQLREHSLFLCLCLSFLVSLFLRFSLPFSYFFACPSLSLSKFRISSVLACFLPLRPAVYLS